jgi:hypothetical protein
MNDLDAHDFEARLQDAFQTVRPPVAPDAATWTALRSRLGQPAHAAPSDTPIYTEVTVMPIPSRRYRLLATAAALVLVAGVLGVVVGSRRDAPSPLPAGPGDGSIPRFVLDSLPKGLVLDFAYEPLAGSRQDAYVVSLRSLLPPISGARIEAWPGAGSSMSGDDVTAVTVNGLDARLQQQPDGPANLLWNDGAVTYQLMAEGPSAADRSFVLGLANSVSRSDTQPVAANTPPEFTLSSIPTGFAVTYAGPARDLQPDGGYAMMFRRSGDPAIVTPEIYVAVYPRGMSAERLAEISQMTATTQGGVVVYLDSNDDRSVSNALFDLPGGFQARVTTTNLHAGELLKTIRHLRAVSEAEWTKAMGAKLDRTGLDALTPSPTVAPSTSTTAPSPSIEIAEARYTCGPADGPWVYSKVSATTVIEVVAQVLLDDRVYGQSNPTTLEPGTHMTIEFDPATPPEAYGRTATLRIVLASAPTTVAASSSVVLKIPDGMSCG